MLKNQSLIYVELDNISPKNPKIKHEKQDTKKTLYDTLSAISIVSVDTITEYNNDAVPIFI